MVVVVQRGFEILHNNGEVLLEVHACRYDITDSIQIFRTEKREKGVHPFQNLLSGIDIVVKLAMPKPDTVSQASSFKLLSSRLGTICMSS